ncbi:FHA domain-containing protein [Actinobacteria bacterium IMCC26256]|nr:FHA domain-containing protein [Actinobacteria bacterium IMCC26256]
MKCSKCGHLNLEDARLCSSCGALTGDSEQRDFANRSEIDSGEATLSIAAVESAETASNIPSAPGAFLRVVRGPNAGSKFALSVGSLEVGRHPASGIFLDDITVSRRHCVFNCTAAASDGSTEFAIAVSDAGSLNGTYVNRKLITTIDLAPGDEIQIGRYVVMIELAR